MLAFYSWELDEQQLVPKHEVAELLTQLALAAPAADAETSTRLWLKAVAASDEGRGVKADEGLRQRERWKRYGTASHAEDFPIPIVDPAPALKRLVKMFGSESEELA